MNKGLRIAGWTAWGFLFGTVAKALFINWVTTILSIIAIIIMITFMIKNINQIEENGELAR